MKILAKSSIEINRNQNLFNKNSCKIADQSHKKLDNVKGEK